MFIKRTLLALSLVGLAGNALAQIDTTATSDSDALAEVKADVRLDLREVPLNRTVKLTIDISWEGDLDRFEIEKIEAPILKNLEVVGNSSANRVGQQDGKARAVKYYEFVLQPQDLGMAYVDGSVIKYRDTVAGKSQRLVTNRLQLKVIDPILERDTKKILIFGALGLLCLGVVTLSIVLAKKRREKEAARLRAQEDSRPLEETYLADLKTEVDLNGADLGESFSRLSRLLRRYLSEKYAFAAMGLTTKEIARELEGLALDKHAIEATTEVLDVCDVAKFSGQMEKSKLDRVYTLLEEVLANGKHVKHNSDKVEN